MSTARKAKLTIHCDTNQENAQVGTSSNGKIDEIPVTPADKNSPTPVNNPTACSQPNCTIDGSSPPQLPVECKEESALDFLSIVFANTSHILTVIVSAMEMRSCIFFNAIQRKPMVRPCVMSLCSLQIMWRFQHSCKLLDVIWVSLSVSALVTSYFRIVASSKLVALGSKTRQKRRHKLNGRSRKSMLLHSPRI